MSEIIESLVYSFRELADDARARARDWYRDGAFDYPWYDFVYQDFETVCGLIGVTLKTSTVRLMGGSSRQAPNIYFRGFSSQGDGACFEGRYRYRPGATLALQCHAPNDQELLAVALALQTVQRRNFYQLVATAIHRGRYYHEYCMAVDVDRDSPAAQDPTSDAEETVKEALRDLARWLYAQLEREYDHLNSDEVINATLEASDYRFTEDGNVFD